MKKTTIDLIKTNKFGKKNCEDFRKNVVIKQGCQQIEKFLYKGTYSYRKGVLRKVISKI